MLANAPQLAQTAAYAIMVLAMVLTIFVPFFPGAALFAAAVVGFEGTLYGLTGLVPDTGRLVVDAAIVLICLIGTFSGAIADKLGFRFTYASVQLVWGGFLGMILFAVLQMPLWLQIIGLFLGSIAAAAGVEKRPFKEALTRGPMGIYSLLGPRGFQLLMLVLAGDLVRTHGL